MFILLAALLTLLIAAALVWPFLRPRSAMGRAAYDVEAFRAQLRELEQDIARGVVTAEDAEAARIEISRRLLAADEIAQQEAAASALPATLRGAMGMGLAFGVPLLAVLAYLGLGSPQLPASPFAERSSAAFQTADGVPSSRPNQEQAEREFAESGEQQPENDAANAEFGELLERLKQRLAETPNDPRGLALLARTERRMERYSDAWRSYGRAINAYRDQGEDIDSLLLTEMAETMVYAAGGYVSPEAEQVIDAALVADAGDPQNRYYKAFAMAQRGELREAYDRWSALLADAEPGSEWAIGVYEQTAQAARELGEPIPAPPEWMRRAANGGPMQGAATAPGPSAEDMRAAAEMTPEERSAMIESMVAGLAERLEDEPQNLEGWLRLFGAYKVLGKTEEIAAAAETARATFAGNPDALQAIDQALQ